MCATAADCSTGQWSSYTTTRQIALNTAGENDLSAMYTTKTHHVKFTSTGPTAHREIPDD
ncbi:hypothetical protein QTP88_017274 [Uroleucon formosanum]